MLDDRLILGVDQDMLHLIKKCTLLIDDDDCWSRHAGFLPFHIQPIAARLAARPLAKKRIGTSQQGVCQCAP
jgi:hypothetical protein